MKSVALTLRDAPMFNIHVQFDKTLERDIWSLISFEIHSMTIPNARTVIRTGGYK